MAPIFNKTQINAIVSKACVKMWSDDIAEAFFLRSISSKCYEYLRTKKGIHLPCKSTLNKRAQIFACERGVLHSVLAIMNKKAEAMHLNERKAVISFDEMSIANEWCCDKGKDIFITHMERYKLQWFVE